VGIGLNLGMAGLALNPQWAVNRKLELIG